MRNLISLGDITPTTLQGLVTRAVRIAANPDVDRVLTGRAVGIYFSKASTRTRTSFWRAATRLGADVITSGFDDLQLTTGELLSDTARVLSLYLDALVVRTNGPVEHTRVLGSRDDLAVVNALSADEHPTQAVADLAALEERFGDLSGLNLLYVGEGNSSASALLLAAAHLPDLRLTVLCPPGYGIPKAVVDVADELSAGRSTTTHLDAVEDLTGKFDAVYTSRWQQMGVPKADPRWLDAFRGFQVDRALLDRVGESHTVLLHDLPAVRGQEVTDEVLDGPRSLAWRQAYHKMTSAMSVLEWCVLDRRP
ncbi:ornithine carbamoyltransferase [Actinosynnema sp. NPDC020468]|uniref:ornithine carbamoyltransferase n=1 Tax=Actinosynnema sp. NPDC020468 TaxID=3154488 RepID=UPI0034025A5C